MNYNYTNCADPNYLQTLPRKSIYAQVSMIKKDIYSNDTLIRHA